MNKLLPFWAARSYLSTGRRRLSCVKRTSYSQKSWFSSLPRETRISTCGWPRAARDRNLETPPRRLTALRNPPPTVTMSWRKRNASRKLDFPDAFGPIRKARSRRATSDEEKFLQFRSAIRVKRRDCPLDLFIGVYSTLECCGRVTSPTPPPHASPHPPAKIQTPSEAPCTAPTPQSAPRRGPHRLIPRTSPIPSARRPR